MPARVWLIAALLALLVVPCLSSLSPSFPTGNFASSQDFLHSYSGRYGSTAVVCGEKWLFLIAGASGYAGIGGYASMTNDVFVSNSSSFGSFEVFQSAAPRFSERAGAQGICTGKQLILFGGYGGSPLGTSILDDLWSFPLPNGDYDPYQNWVVLQNSISPPSGQFHNRAFGAIFLDQIHQELCIFGGGTPLGPLKMYQKLMFTSNTLVCSPVDPVLGITAANTNYAKWQLRGNQYNASGDSNWPSPRMYFGYSAIDSVDFNGLLVTGGLFWGSDSLTQLATNEVWLFNCSTRNFTLMQTPPFSPRNAPIVVSYTSNSTEDSRAEIYVFSGSIGPATGPSFVNDAWVSLDYGNSFTQINPSEPQYIARAAGFGVSMRDSRPGIGNNSLNLIIGGGISSSVTAQQEQTAFGTNIESRPLSDFLVATNDPIVPNTINLPPSNIPSGLLSSWKANFLPSAQSPWTSRVGGFLFNDLENPSNPIIVVGGGVRIFPNKSTTWLNDLWMSQDEGGNWTQISMSSPYSPAEGSAFIVAPQPDGSSNFFFFGGIVGSNGCFMGSTCNSFSTLNNGYYANSRSLGVWKYVSHSFPPRGYASMAIVKSAALGSYLVYAGGGQFQSSSWLIPSKFLNDVYSCNNMKTFTFSCWSVVTLAAAWAPRLRASLIVLPLNPPVYMLIGGQMPNTAGNRYFDVWLSYEPAVDLWLPQQRFNGSQRFSMAAIYNNSEIFLIGGRSPVNGSLSEVLGSSDGGFSFAQINSQNSFQGVEGAQVTKLSNGEFFFLGGFNGQLGYTIQAAFISTNRSLPSFSSSISQSSTASAQFSSSSSAPAAFSSSVLPSDSSTGSFAPALLPLNSSQPFIDVDNNHIFRLSQAIQAIGSFPLFLTLFIEISSYSLQTPHFSMDFSQSYLLIEGMQEIHLNSLLNQQIDSNYFTFTRGFSWWNFLFPVKDLFPEDNENSMMDSSMNSTISQGNRRLLSSISRPETLYDTGSESWNRFSSSLSIQPYHIFPLQLFLWVLFFTIFLFLSVLYCFYIEIHYFPWFYQWKGRENAWKRIKREEIEEFRLKPREEKDIPMKEIVPQGNKEITMKIDENGGKNEFPMVEKSSVETDENSPSTTIEAFIPTKYAILLDSSAISQPEFLIAHRLWCRRSHIHQVMKISQYFCLLGYHSIIQSAILQLIIGKKSDSSSSSSSSSSSAASSSSASSTLWLFVASLFFVAFLIFPLFFTHFLYQDYSLPMIGPSSLSIKEKKKKRLYENSKWFSILSPLLGMWEWTNFSQISFISVQLFYKVLLSIIRGCFIQYGKFQLILLISLHLLMISLFYGFHPYKDRLLEKLNIMKHFCQLGILFLLLPFVFSSSGDSLNELSHQSSYSLSILAILLHLVWLMISMLFLLKAQGPRLVGIFRAWKNSKKTKEKEEEKAAHHQRKEEQQEERL